MKTLNRQQTKYGQAILDIVYGESAHKHGMGCISGSVGQTANVVAAVAEKLGKPVRSVAGAMADLIRKGFFGNEGLTESPIQSGIVTERVTHDRLFLTHQGWEAFGGWNEKEAVEKQGMESVEDWRKWDGADGMPYPMPDFTCF